MARVTHVKKARQRFAMVPVLDENGQPKRTPVMKTVSVRNEETGEYEKVQRPKTTKTGRPVTMAVTVQDKEKPLPNLKCDFAGCDIDGGEILPGTPYKHITPRSGPYGGTQRNRHEAHPSWNIWEYSYSRAAQVAFTQHNMEAVIAAWTPTDEGDFEALVEELQEMAEEAAEDAREAVSNMPEQLQDSSVAAENADALESWAEEFSNAPSLSESFLQDCEACDGAGEIEEECTSCYGSGELADEDEDDTTPCPECDGSGTELDACPECDGGTTEDINPDWVEEARDVLYDLVSEVGL